MSLRKAAVRTWQIHDAGAKARPSSYRLSSDVRSDSGYDMPGKADAGGVDARNQGPEGNRYRAYGKAQRRARRGRRRPVLPSQRARWS